MNRLSISQGTSNLPVLGKVESSNLLSLLDLLLVGLHLALQLVDQSLHSFVIFLVLVGRENQFLDASLRLPQVLGHISKSSSFGIKLRLKLPDPSLHLDHCLPSTLQSIGFSFVGSVGSILALGFKQLLVLLKVHGKILFSSQFIGESSSINHGTGSLLLRQFSFASHLIKVGIQLSPFVIELPLSSGNGLVGIGEIGKSFVGVSKFLFSGAALAVSSFQESTAFLKSILHGSSLPVCSNLGISSLGLQGRLLINLGLGISDLGSVLLHGGLGLKVSSNSVFKGKSQFTNITFKLLLHSQSLSFTL